MPSFLGLDIGGANLKASDGESHAKSCEFPLWQCPERLTAALHDLIQEFTEPSGFAVTMTGELADCFPTKSEGVDWILQAVETVAENRPVFVWQTGAEFVSPDIAREIPLLVAAANWHALATFAGRMVPEGLSLLIDMGSTTTDIIPLLNGVPIPSGLTDRERLTSGELVYTGVHRTPLCAVRSSVDFQGTRCRVAAELFATVQDVYLLLGALPESPNSIDTANGKPATQAAAHDRLARMLCCDRTEVCFEEAFHIAEQFASEQRQQLSEAILQVLNEQSEPLSQVIVSGSGAFLIEQLCQEVSPLNGIETILLGEIFQPEIAEAACAFAVARLADERLPLG